MGREGNALQHKAPPLLGSTLLEQSVRCLELIGDGFDQAWS